MRKILINILCGFIPSRWVRRRLRLDLKTPIRKYIKFAKSFSTKRHPTVKYTYGYRCANFVISVDDKWVFKFPSDNNGYDIAMREKRITDALRPISPIKIPEMEILDLDGVAVRKYECIKGVNFRSFGEKTQDEHAEKIAKQLADFLYVVGSCDPEEIRDLKPKKTDKPRLMHGWNQNDLWDNFIINPKTFDVIAAIDWESADFNSFEYCFTNGTHNKIVKEVLLREYLKLYLKGQY